MQFVAGTLGHWEFWRRWEILECWRWKISSSSGFRNSQACIRLSYRCFRWLSLLSYFFIKYNFCRPLAKSYEILIKKKICDIMCDGVTIFFEYLNNGIYVVSRSSVMYTSGKRPRIEDVSDTYLWHYRLGHVNKNRINKLI